MAALLSDNRSPPPPPLCSRHSLAITERIECCKSNVKFHNSRRDGSSSRLPTAPAVYHWQTLQRTSANVSDWENPLLFASISFSFFHQPAPVFLFSSSCQQEFSKKLKILYTSVILSLACVYFPLKMTNQSSVTDVRQMLLLNIVPVHWQKARGKRPANP